jgi:acyl-CoA dehydrogenase
VDSEEFEAVLDAVRTFVRDKAVPAEWEIEESDRIPDSLRQTAAEMGLYGYALPEEHGGLGMTMREQVILIQELGWTTPALRSMVSTNNGIAGQVLVNAGTDAQKQSFLPELASGRQIAAFALTESEAGSDPSGIRTRATRDGDSYILNGSKRYISNALAADFFVVFARTSGQPGSTDGISVFITPSDSAGLSVGPKDRKMGQRGSETAEVYFDNVKVPRELLLGEEGRGFSVAMSSLAQGRLHVAAMSVGMARRLVHESLFHATTTRQGGTKIADFQLVAALLADCQTETMAGEALVMQAAHAWDEETDRRMAPSAAKLFCSEMVDRVADRAVQIHGGAGYMREMPVERFYRDSRLFRLYEGTSEIQRLIIAKQMVKAFCQ